MKNQFNHAPSAKGFTLLEMSIVLIIIGVIVAGVLVGRTMITSSQLQSVMTDAGNYMSAVGNFKTTYQALPGDFANAEALWGTDTGGCPAGGGVVGTCNGDGNGKIGPNCSGGSVSFTYGNESFRAWQHLNSAGLIANALTGITNGGTYTVTPGKNVVKSSLNGGGFNLMWLDDPALCSNNFGLITGSGQYGNVLQLVSGTTAGVLTAEQAESIDRKMDDGTPDTGKVRAPGVAALPNCTLHPSGYTYNVSGSGLTCALLFLNNY